MHDPKVDPAIGDVLERGGIRRTVLDTDEKRVTFTTPVDNGVYVIRRTTWKLWSEGARIIHDGSVTHE